MAPRDSGSTYEPLPEKRPIFGYSGREYIEFRQKEDGADGLWRIHDRIYDLSNFAKSHPGGSYWINMTKGIDITELFESHHVGPAADRVLEKFSWKAATTPRKSPFTFHDDGFYRRTKRKAAIALKDVPNRGGVTWKSSIVSDTLALTAAVMSIMSVLTGNYLYALAAGVAIGLLFTSSHNFTHLRSNWRQYYITVAWLSMHDWRTSHILSHHNFPNTDVDMEVQELEPLIDFYPRENEPWKKWLQVVMTPFYLAGFWPYAFFVRYFIERRAEPADFLNFSPLVLTLLTTLVTGLGTEGVIRSLVTFVIIGFTHSFTANMIGFTVAHHYPTIYHHGDEPRADRDWGLLQLDAVRERADSKTNFLLSCLTFGEHATHHLFPSLDLGRLELVRPAVDETLKEMGLARMEESWPSIFVGTIKQILRSEGNAFSLRDNTKKEK